MEVLVQKNLMTSEEFRNLRMQLSSQMKKGLNLVFIRIKRLRDLEF